MARSVTMGHHKSRLGVFGGWHGAEREATSDVEDKIEVARRASSMEGSVGE